MQRELNRIKALLAQVAVNAQLAAPRYWMGQSSGKNLPAFSQHLAAFGGQMCILRTTTCNV